MVICDVPQDLVVKAHPATTTTTTATTTTTFEIEIEIEIEMEMQMEMEMEMYAAIETGCPTVRPSCRRARCRVPRRARWSRSARRAGVHTSRGYQNACGAVVGEDRATTTTTTTSTTVTTTTTTTPTATTTLGGRTMRARR